MCFETLQFRSARHWIQKQLAAHVSSLCPFQHAQKMLATLYFYIFCFGRNYAPFGCALAQFEILSQVL